jgi:hypothetical protein
MVGVKEGVLTGVSSDVEVCVAYRLIKKRDDSDGL